MHRSFSIASALTVFLLAASSLSWAAPRRTLSAPAPADHPRLAQNLPCASDVTPEEARRYLERDPAVPGSVAGAPGPPYYIPIAPHIVRESDSSGGMPEAQYEQAIADANLAYTNMGMIFYTPFGIDYIDSDAFYFDIDTLAEIDVLRSTNFVPDAINIYFTPTLDYEGGAICGISAFTTSSVQSIAMRNSCTATGTNHSTFQHEIGHFFDLFHTHETGFDVELVDGSNCDTAGDLLCDTPADPRLSSGTVDSETCAYTGDETDGNDDPYDPDTSQFLSYSLKWCRNTFSPEAETRVVATLLNERPNLIAQPVSARGPSVDTDLRDGAKIALARPRPNPTGGTTELAFALDRSQSVELAIYDVRGARIRTLASGRFDEGQHVVAWAGVDTNGRVVAPGIYFARLSVGEQVVSRKIQLIR